MPPDLVLLLKLVWHPDNLEGMQVMPTAFRSQDLNGTEGAHVSVDRQDLAVRATMEALAARQAENADGVNHIRKAAFIGRMACGDVRSLRADGLCPLQVAPVPIEGNAAHCGIFNTTGIKRRSFVDEIRGKLAVLASPAVGFDEAYGDAPEVQG